jgi:hypothetical protein
MAILLRELRQKKSKVKIQRRENMMSCSASDVFV